MELGIEAEHHSPPHTALLLLFATIFCAVSLSAYNHAVGGEPVAIVEEVSDPSVGVQPMDILEEGRVIRLSQNASLTLGYLHSCIRETIVGGQITIGRDKSHIENSKRQTETVDCDGNPIAKPSRLGAEVAGAAFRKSVARKKNWPKPNWVLHGTVPLLRLSEPNERILIERLDKDSEMPLELTLEGLVTDFSKASIKLDPGGLYVMSVGSKRYVIKVSPLAIPDAPLLSRLIIM